MAYPKTIYLGGNPLAASLMFDTAEQERAIMESGFFDGYLPEKTGSDAGQLPEKTGSDAGQLPEKTGSDAGQLPVQADPNPELQPIDAPKRRGRPPKQAA